VPAIPFVWQSGHTAVFDAQAVFGITGSVDQQQERYRPLTTAVSSQSTHQGHASATSAVWPVQLWLGVMIGLILAMIVVGGATRLTDSGLSITEWKPLLGAIPPLSDADWRDAFAKYKLIPEYREINAGMSLAEFKFIFWWEWAHRFLGRFIGLVFAVPLVGFWIAGHLPHRMKPWLVGLLVLGGVQGFLGWYMVQSGLVDRVDVSHYRLALHLTTAFVILALMTWCFLELGYQAGARAVEHSVDTHVAAHHLWTAWILIALMLLQVVLGAFVAGLKAGLTYNTWPLMDGAIIPAGLFSQSPWWINFTENITTVQFDHRLMAYVLLALGIWHAVAVWWTARVRTAVVSGGILAVALIVQAGVGIATLLAAQGAIPIGLGLAHQGGAAVVLVIAVWHVHRLSRAG